jgi:hypothetical protein
LVLLVRVDELGRDSEVGKFRIAEIVEQDVPSFNVSVNQLGVVKVLKTSEYSKANSSYLLLG